MEINRPFLGYALNAVDAKGRVSVPSAFRTRITERCRDFGKDATAINDKRLNIILHKKCDRLVAYDDIGIEKLSADLAASVQDLPWAERREALDELTSDELGSVLIFTFDDAGRLVIPETQRKRIGITDQAVFWGFHNGFEIWSPEKARAAFADNPRKLTNLEDLLAGKAKG